VEVVPAIEPVRSVLELDVLGVDEELVEEDVLGVLLATDWSWEERCEVCVLWSGDVLLEIELPVVEPVDATELLWPVVSVDCVLLELGGVEERSA
jgi:hypothetical protein